MIQKMRSMWLLLCAALGLFCAAAFSPPIASAADQKCDLELIKMEANRPGFRVPREEQSFRRVYAQRFTLSLGRKNAHNPYEKEFKRIVKKEPEKYVFDSPFRGVAHLGSKPYAFVLDKKDESSPGYDVLYFDANGNGDLTDDEKIEAYEEPALKNKDAKLPAKPARPNFWSYFPRVDLQLGPEGGKYDYAFTFSVYQQTRKYFSYVMANLASGAYRRGEATLDGEKQTVVLLDSNSNGRFDDMIKMPSINPRSRGRIRPSYGDALLIGKPKDETAQSRNVQQFTSQYLAKLTIIDGDYYDVKVTPSGDEIVWTAADVSSGEVVSPHKNCVVTLVNDQACIPLTLKDSKPVKIPVGQWRIFTYNITDDEWENSKEKADGDNNKIQRKLPAPYVSGWGTCQMEPIEVRSGEITDLKFGPPFKLSVGAYHMPGQVRFSMAIEGEAGEAVTAIMLKGRRPPKPKITITDQKGEVVQEGNFEYG